MRILIAALVATVLVTADASVAGTWSMTVDTPHGAMTMELTLKQEGTKVTGTFISGPHPDMAVEGTFADRTLKLETTGDMKISFTAKLKDDGKLAGSLSTEMGDMAWTAEPAPRRDKERR
jgi:hypothetical protein